MSHRASALVMQSGYTVQIIFPAALCMALDAVTVAAGITTLRPILDHGRAKSASERALMPVVHYVCDSRGR